MPRSYASPALFDNGSAVGGDRATMPERTRGVEVVVHQPQPLPVKRTMAIDGLNRGVPEAQQPTLWIPLIGWAPDNSFLVFMQGRTGREWRQWTDVSHATVGGGGE